MTSGIVDAADAGKADAIVAANEGLLADLGFYGAAPSDELINAMGIAWVCRAAGAPSLDEGGLDWCAEYDAAYIRTLTELVGADQ
jgi:hypothetical protein